MERHRTLLYRACDPHHCRWIDMDHEQLELQPDASDGDSRIILSSQLRYQ